MADEVRMIDANKLKKAIKILCEDERNPLNITAIAYFALCELVDTMPTIEPEPVNGWISVKDRLPENETEVLIYCPEFVCTIKLAMWIEDGFYVDREDLIVKPAPNGYCTHWQPLPEPPKEGAK